VEEDSYNPLPSGIRRIWGPTLLFFFFPLDGSALQAILPALSTSSFLSSFIPLSPPPPPYLVGGNGSGPPFFSFFSVEAKTGTFLFSGDTFCVPPPLLEGGIALIQVGPRSYFVISTAGIVDNGLPTFLSLGAEVLVSSFPFFPWRR